jgi:hypothetical protein
MSDEIFKKNAGSVPNDPLSDSVQKIFKPFKSLSQVRSNRTASPVASDYQLGASELLACHKKNIGTDTVSHENNGSAVWQAHLF